MKYVSQFLRILVFCWLGEVLHALLPVPVPASIYGLALLLGALKAGLVRLEQVREAAGFLIAVFPLLFGPGAVGIMELGLLAGIWLPVLLAVSLVTVLVMAAAGWAAQAVIRRKGARHG